MAGLDDLFDPDDVADWLKSDETKEAKLGLAGEAVTFAKGISPADTGEYAASIHVGVYGDDVYMEIDDPKAHIIEYGSEDTPEFAIRARTEAYFNAR